MRWMVLIAATCAFLTAPAVADLQLSGGSISVGSGITANSAWNVTSTSLTWTVSNSGGGWWKYEYSFNAPQKELSHIIFETSRGLTATDFRDFQSNYEFGWELGSYTKAGDVDLPGDSDMYGIKFNRVQKDTVAPWEISFEANRSPMWGNFFAKDGKDAGADVWAHNTDFLYLWLDDEARHAATTATWHIAVPNTHVVPVPGAVLLGFLGLGYAGMRLRREV